MWEEYFSVIQTAPLFKNVSNNEMSSMLGCLGAQMAGVNKGEAVLLAGDRPQHIGIVLAGTLHIVKDDYDGNRNLVGAVGPGDIFAEALCCAGTAESPVSVLADTDAVVLLMRFDRILHTCPNSCVFHTQLIENMLGIVAQKNLMLQSRMEIISLHAVRAKVLKYLEGLAARQGREITVPFNREELANYLCVERSALSHELARMKKDGLILYKKNSFTLLK